MGALAEAPRRWRHGYDLCAELGMQAGSMYPILIRLADRGLLETSWETERAPGRPARHLYRLTAAGRAYANSAAPTTTARRSRPRLAGAGCMASACAPSRCWPACSGS